ncbi:MAG: hypothetical protein WCA16_06810 [Candidatus Sulfotelmatobacter sp.]
MPPFIRIRQSEIAVHEGIPRLVGTVNIAEAAMARSERVPERLKLAACILCCVRLLSTVVQMNLDLAPASPAMVRQRLNETLIVLLRGVEIGVTKSAAIMISPGIGHPRIFPAPFFEAPLLLLVGSTGSSVPGYDGRFEMVCEG